MAQYILINNGDENISFAIDTDEEREAARAALTAAGETSAAVFVGDPDDCDAEMIHTGERFELEATKLEKLIARITDGSSVKVSPVRVTRLTRAIALGASDKILEAIADAGRTSDTDTIVLPCHRFENLSRGKGWARKGSKNNAEWGERASGGYRVGPGTWTVGGNDGFSRKGEDKWVVKHVTVGTETWTIAS